MWSAVGLVTATCNKQYRSDQAMLIALLFVGNTFRMLLTFSRNIEHCVVVAFRLSSLTWRKWSSLYLATIWIRGSVDERNDKFSVNKRDITTVFVGRINDVHFRCCGNYQVYLQVIRTFRCSFQSTCCPWHQSVGCRFVRLGL